MVFNSQVGFSWSTSISSISSYTLWLFNIDMENHDAIN
jgi:hypothetical protein